MATKKVSAPPDKALLYRKLLDSVDGVDIKYVRTLKPKPNKSKT
jgi:hypothetical protein